MATCMRQCRLVAPQLSRNIITTSSLAKLKDRYATSIEPRFMKSKIKIHAPIPGPPQKDTMQVVSDSLMSRYDPTGERQAMISRRNAKALRVGQVLSIYAYNNYPAQTPISVFSGYLIGIKRSGVESSLRLRSQVMRIGTEMRFPLFSPTIKEIRVIKDTPPKKIRRAKLFYMRTEKHDRGAVDGILKQDRERRESKEREAKRAARK